MEKFNKSDPDILSKDKAVHFAKVKKGGYAFISDRTPLQRQAVDDGSCELTVLKYTFKPMPLGIALRQKSSYKKIFAERFAKYICTSSESRLNL